VAGFGLRFGGDGHEEFVALARDVVDPNLDLCLFSPFIDEISRSKFVHEVVGYWPKNRLGVDAAVCR